MASAKATVNHDKIRRWVEQRGGHPAHVKRTARRNDPGVLRIDYPGFSGGKSLERIDWDQWFDWFDKDNLAFLYQPERDSRFSKLVDRKSVDVDRAPSSRVAKRTTSSTRSSVRTPAARSRKMTAASTRSASSSSSRKTTKRAGKRTASPASRVATLARHAIDGLTKSVREVTSRSTPIKSRSRAGSRASAARSTSSRRSTAATRTSAAKPRSSSRSTGNGATRRKTASAGNGSAKRRTTTRTTTRASSASSKRTTNHDQIRRWVEARGGHPAHVKSTGRRSDPGVLRIDYPGYSGTKTLERIDWDTWFDWFDRDGLAFLYQNKKDSRFSKLVKR